MVLGPDGMTKESIFSRSFSVSAQTMRGTKITLLFLNDTNAEDFILALGKFETLMARHHASEGDDPLSALMDSRTQPAPTWHQLIYLNPESKRLELINYVQSSKLKRLVSDEIPDTRV